MLTVTAKTQKPDASQQGSATPDHSPGEDIHRLNVIWQRGKHRIGQSTGDAPADEHSTTLTLAHYTQ